MEPGGLPVYLGAYDAFGDDPFRICPPSFLERMEIANSNGGIALPMKAVHELKARCLVDLPTFGAWAANVWSPLPSAFPVQTETLKPGGAVEEAMEDANPPPAPCPEIVHGHRIWRLRPAVEEIAANVGASADALLVQAKNGIAAGKLTARDPAAGWVSVPGDAALAEMLDWFFSEDINAWLDAIRVPFAYRLPGTTEPSAAVPPLGILDGVPDDLRRADIVTGQRGQSVVSEAATIAPDDPRGAWWNQDYDPVVMAKDIESLRSGGGWGVNQRGRRAGKVPLKGLCEEVAKNICAKEAESGGKSRTIGYKSIEKYLKAQGWT